MITSFYYFKNCIQFVNPSKNILYEILKGMSTAHLTLIWSVFI